jgi:hypothetical protein
MAKVINRFLPEVKDYFNIIYPCVKITEVETSLGQNSPREYQATLNPGS